MSRLVIPAVLLLACSCTPLAAWSALPLKFPASSDGYVITGPDVSRAAPGGWEGQINSATKTAIGNTPATAGKRFVIKYTLSNQIRTCPRADGTSEGTGELAFSFDYTDAQAQGTSNTHIEMRATARYMGTVGDDAWLINPGDAEIDYVYDQTGSFRGANSAIASSPPIHNAQRITIPVAIGSSMEMPRLGVLRGGDPTAGKYVEAYGTGMALAYWGGVFWSVAQVKWRLGECAEVAFDPPSGTAQPALGTDTIVMVEVKSRIGESARAQIVARAHEGGGHVTGGGRSEAGAPLRLTYTAPAAKTAKAGFSVNAISRAGIATAEWDANPGTGWTGQIQCSSVTRDEGHDTLQDWRFSDINRITIDVKNDIATGHAYGETQESEQARQKKAVGGGAVALVQVSSTTSHGSAEGRGEASIAVTLNKSAGTYSIRADYAGPREGKRQIVSCVQGRCDNTEMDAAVAGCLPSVITGAAGNFGHLHGETTVDSPVHGRSGKGSTTVTVTWNLARQGTTGP